MTAGGDFSLLAVFFVSDIWFYVTEIFLVSSVEESHFTDRQAAIFSRFYREPIYLEDQPESYHICMKRKKSFM